MPITNYEKPQLTISDSVQVTQPSSTGRFRALVVGPRYRLNRYGRDAQPAGTLFSAAGQTVAFKYLEGSVETLLPPTDVLDAASIALYGEGLEATLATFTSGSTNKFYLTSPATPHIIKITAGAVKGTGIDTAFSERPVTAGDIVYVNDGVSGVRRRTVTGLIGAGVASSYSAAANSGYNPMASMDAYATVVTVPAAATMDPEDIVVTNFHALVRGSSFQGKYGDEFTLVCTTGGVPGTAKFDISSASGLWHATGVTTGGASHSYTLTSTELAGVTVAFGYPDGAAAEADVFVFRAFGAYARLSTSQVVSGDAGSGYTGPRDTNYLVTVTTGSAAIAGSGAKVRIADVNGVDSVQTDVAVTAGSAINVGSYGLRVTFVNTGFTAQPGLRAGDTYVIQATAATMSTTVFDKVVLDGPIGDGTLFSDTTAALAVEFRQAFTGKITSGWTSNATGIIVAAALTTNVAGRSCAFVTSVGRLFPSYRSLVPALTTDDQVEVSTQADITSNFGPIDLENDIAWAANTALTAANGRTVSVLATTGLVDTDFAAALAKVEATDSIYPIALISSDLAVVQAGNAHAAAMNAKDVKNFRKIYSGVDSPGSYPVQQKQADNSVFTCTISTHNGINTLVTAAAGTVYFTTLGLVAGDRFLLPISGEEFKIASIVSDTEILLVTGPTNPVSPAVPYELWRANTPSSQRDYLNQRAAAISCPFVMQLWQENGTSYVDGVPTIIPNRFLAAEYAGIRSSLLSQQGMTQTEVTSVTACPAMYLRYNSTLLNDIAAHGTCIVTQDFTNGPVYVRHQLTTDVARGSLFYEDNAYIIIHDLDFQTKDGAAGFIGKKNAVQEVLDSLYIVVEAIHTGATVTSNKDVGPLIIAFSGLSVTFHPILKDRAIVKCIRTIPLPLNNIDVEYTDIVTVAV